MIFKKRVLECSRKVLCLLKLKTFCSDDEDLFWERTLGCVCLKKRNRSRRRCYSYLVLSSKWTPKKKINPTKSIKFIFSSRHPLSGKTQKPNRSRRWRHQKKFTTKWKILFFHLFILTMRGYQCGGPWLKILPSTLEKKNVWIELKVAPEFNHHRGKYHWKANLLFDWFGFD